MSRFPTSVLLSLGYILLKFLCVCVPVQNGNEHWFAVCQNARVCTHLRMILVKKHTSTTGVHQLEEESNPPQNPVSFLKS